MNFDKSDKFRLLYTSTGFFLQPFWKGYELKKYEKL